MSRIRTRHLTRKLYFCSCASFSKTKMHMRKNIKCARPRTRVCHGTHLNEWYYHSFKWVSHGTLPMKHSTHLNGSFHTYQRAMSYRQPPQQCAVGSCRSRHIRVTSHTRTSHGTRANACVPWASHTPASHRCAARSNESCGVATINRLLKWLRLIGSFAKEPYKRDDILQKRPIILSILLTVATPKEPLNYWSIPTRISLAPES